MLAHSRTPLAGLAFVKRFVEVLDGGFTTNDNWLKSEQAVFEMDWDTEVVVRDTDDKVVVRSNDNVVGSTKVGYPIPTILVYHEAVNHRL